MEVEFWSVLLEVESCRGGQILLEVKSWLEAESWIEEYCWVQAARRANLLSLSLGIDS